MSNQQVARKKKDPLDFYETPAEAVHALMKAETFAGGIWEPCAGNGAIAKVLLQYGHHPYCTDIVQREYPLHGTYNFLTAGVWSNADNVITNPPYNQAEEIVRKALSLTYHKVAMFMRIGFLESQGRYPMFTREGLAPSRVLVFSNRMNCDPAVKSSQVCYAWYVWDQQDIRTRQQLGAKSVTTIHWITTLEGL